MSKKTPTQTKSILSQKTIFLTARKVHALFNLGYKFDCCSENRIISLFIINKSLNDFKTK